MFAKKRVIFEDGLFFKDKKEYMPVSLNPYRIYDITIFKSTNSVTFWYESNGFIQWNNLTDDSFGRLLVWLKEYTRPKCVE